MIDRDRFNAAWVHDAASPLGWLPPVFAPLTLVPPRAIRAVWADLTEQGRIAAMVKSARKFPERELTQAQYALPDLAKVVSNFEERLPRSWVDLMCWGHWVATSLLPPEMPSLRHAFEALIEHEPQLHFEPYYPNRDHLVHQIADSALAVDLHDRARRGNTDYDKPDWELLRECVPGLTDEHRELVTRAGLALAGLTHDVGYLRYIGATARERLASVFGVTAPAASMDPRDLARLFAGSLLDRMLAERDEKGNYPRVGDGILVDLYLAAWKKGDHGPFSATVLASVARGLASEGRSIPVIDAILQVAAAAAFCHEIHPVKPKEDDPFRPDVIREARKRLNRFRWPALFRIVDEMQCWFRPELRARPEGISAGSCHHHDRAEMALGAREIILKERVLTITRELTEEEELDYRKRTPDIKVRGAKEGEALEHLRKHLKVVDGGALFAAIGIDEIAWPYPPKEP